MRRFVPYLLCICLCFGLTGCSNGFLSNKEIKTDLAYNNGIKVTAKRPYVRRGEIGMLALKVSPNAEVKIVANYKLSGKNYTAVRNLVAGKDGNIFCTWEVDKNTDTGTYEINIYSGGSHLRTSYMVQ